MRFLSADDIVMLQQLCQQEGVEFAKVKLLLESYWKFEQSGNRKGVHQFFTRILYQGIERDLFNQT